MFYQILRIALCNSYSFLVLPRLKRAKYYIFKMADTRSFAENRKSHRRWDINIKLTEALPPV